jgi:hypothetical protein
MWTGFIWLDTETSVKLLLPRNRLAVSLKVGDFFTRFSAVGFLRIQQLFGLIMFNILLVKACVINCRNSDSRGIFWT